MSLIGSKLFLVRLYRADYHLFIIYIGLNKYLLLHLESWNPKGIPVRHIILVFYKGFFLFISFLEIRKKRIVSGSVSMMQILPDSSATLPQALK